MLALRQLVDELNREVAGYKTFQSVPAQQQANVRNEMYLTSEALRLMQKIAQPGVYRRRKAQR